MPKLDAYLLFNGNCAEAMRFYERVLGGKIEMMMTWGESPTPEQTPPGSDHLIMHTTLQFDGGILMAADDPTSSRGMHGFSLALSYSTVAEAERIFNSLSEGGTVTMPLGETFWVERFGMLVDRFGTPWMVSGGAGKM